MERGIDIDNEAGVVVVGDGNTVGFGTGAGAAVRSAYREQVRRIAPPELVGREEELAELAEFCRTGTGYRWWRADAWAGKTALMAWFALAPPEGVRIVPFFVTARLGAQNDVAAYADVVLEQLAELAGEGLPALLTAATREAHLLRLYASAAEACAARGERLVLLVDGLDEDRGVTTGPDARSIAALLPYGALDLPVVVSGRLHPPLPADVPGDHPLRDPSIVRLLASSPKARAIRAEAERELKHFLTGGGLPYELLGLLTAAGGGLTADDLAELTDEVPYRVRDVLRTGPGRTFALRGDAYLLAHEELVVQAREMLGGRELGRWRGALCDWAEEWRARGWPAGTPTYLLHGYFPMLRAVDDFERMLVCALDAGRHERLLEETGGIGEALREVRATGEAVLARGDRVGLVATMLRLAFRRDDLVRLGGYVLPELAASWAAAGQIDRAVAMVHVEDRSLTVQGLCCIAKRLLDLGDRARAEEIATKVEELYLNEGDRYERDLMSNDLMPLFLSLGRLIPAEQVFLRAEGQSRRAGLLSALIDAQCGVGAYGQAATLAHAEYDSELRVRMTDRIVRALLAEGRPNEAEKVMRAGMAVDEELRLALSLDGFRALRDAGHEERGELLLAEILGVFDDEDAPIVITGETTRALAAASKSGDSDARLSVHEDLDVSFWCRGLARVGAWDRVRRVAKGIPEEERGEIWHQIAHELFETGHLEETEEALACSSHEESFLWHKLSVAYLRAGALDRAWSIRERTDLWWDTGTMAEYTRALCRAGRQEEAMALVADGLYGTGAEIGVADALLDAGERMAAVEMLASLQGGLKTPVPGILVGRVAMAAAALSSVGGWASVARDLFAAMRRHGGLDDDDRIKVLIGMGQRDRAEERAWECEDMDRRYWLEEILKARLAAGEYAAVARLVERAEPDPYELLPMAVRGLVKAGAWEHALPLVSKDPTGADEMELCAVVAAGLAREGRTDEAAGWLRAAEPLWTNPRPYLPALPNVVRALTTSGRREEAVRLVERARTEVTGPYLRLSATCVARALVVLGEHWEAIDYARDVVPLDTEEVIVAVVEQLIDEQKYEWAASIVAGPHPVGQQYGLVYTELALLHPDLNQARECVARALHLEDWHDSLPAVLRCEPGAAPLVAAEGERLCQLLAGQADRVRSEARTSSANASPRT